MNSTNPDPQRRASTEPAPDDASTRRSVDLIGHRIQSRDLFIATREIIILHGADAYRLRLTAQNKLILTK